MWPCRAVIISAGSWHLIDPLTCLFLAFTSNAELLSLAVKKMCYAGLKAMEESQRNLERRRSHGGKDKDQEGEKSF